MTIWNMFRHHVHFFNIDMSFPECQDSYNGVLGQTFKCIYLKGQEKFVWSSPQEETFRLPGLFIATEAFEVNSTCPDPPGFQKRKAKIISDLSGKFGMGKTYDI